jgi:hypothetical protein
MEFPTMTIKKPVIFKLFLGIGAAMGCLITGYIGATESYGFGQPIILIFALISLTVGALSENLIESALLGIVSGVIGSIGITLRLVPFSSFEEWVVILGVLGVLASICCIIGAFVGRLLWSKVHGHHRNSLFE